MNLALLAADLLGVAVLVFALFYRRHGRWDLVVAFIGVNIAVLAVTAALASGSIGAGLGLGLFGVLSIIRLRSQEISQTEVAYYFAALSLGLLGGIGNLPLVLAIGLMGLIIVGLAVVDHPRLARRTQSVDLILDRAITDPEELANYVQATLGGTIRGVEVRKVDLVNDITAVQVRYTPAPADSHQAAPAKESVPQLAGARR